MDTKDKRIPLSSVVGLGDADLCWAVVDPIWPTDETENEIAFLDQGTKGQQAIYATIVYAQEADNGGLAQFFWNSSGMLWQHVQLGLDLLEAREHMHIFTSLLKDFPGETPAVDQTERQRTLGQLAQEQKEYWRSAEKRVYALGGFADTLRPYWKRYIDTHPNDFFLPGSST